jgi:hypothetical protein
MTKQQKFIVLETKSTTGKPSWAIWGRGEGYSYTELVARVYTVAWAEKIVALLNRECDDD